MLCGLVHYLLVICWISCTACCLIYLSFFSYTFTNRLVHVYTADCKFPEAKFALNIAEEMIQHFSSGNQKCILMKSMFYTAKSSHLFALSKYGEVGPAFSFSFFMFIILLPGFTVRGFP